MLTFFQGVAIEKSLNFPPGHHCRTVRHMCDDIGIVAIRGFLRPEFGFAQIAGAKLGAGQIILGELVTSFGGLLVLAARFISLC